MFPGLFEKTTGEEKKTLESNALLKNTGEKYKDFPHFV